MMRSSLDRRYWSAFHTSMPVGLERDGPITFDGLVWRSEGGKTVSILDAVTDDFGNLTAVHVTRH